MFASECSPAGLSFKNYLLNMQEKKFNKIIVPEQWFKKLLLKTENLKKELNKSYINNTNMSIHLIVCELELIGYASSAEFIIKHNKRSR